MKNIAIILILLIFFLIGCNMNPSVPVLAEYTGGKITSSDLYEWLTVLEECPTCSSGAMSARSIKESKPEVKKNYLEMYFLNKVISEEVASKGLDKTDDYKFAVEQGTELFFKQLLHKKLVLQNLHFSEPAVRIRQIHLAVNPFKTVKGEDVNLSPAEINAEIDRMMTKGKEIIARLDKGESFAGLADKYSAGKDEGRGGDIGYLTKGLLPANYAEAAFALKEGEYSKTPIKVFLAAFDDPRNGVYIIKIEDKKEINEKNIDALIQDQALKMAILKPYTGIAESQYIQKLQSAADVAIHLNKIGSKNKNELLFKVGEVNFTVGNLQKLLALNLNRMKSDPGLEELPAVTLEQKRLIVQNEFFYYLLKRDADNKGLTKDPEFVRRMATEREKKISAEYFRQNTKDINVTENEIREAFKRETENNSDQAFAANRDYVRLNLFLQKKSEKANQLRAELRNKYKFKVYEDRL